jgi:hypothetical protein
LKPRNLFDFLNPPEWLARDRAGWAIRLVIASLLFTQLFTPALWRSERVFPHAPVADWVPRLAAPLDSLLLLAEFLLLGAILFRPYRNRWLPAFFGMMVLWVLPDQIRLQPWFYLYGLLLLPATFYRKPSAENDNAGVLLVMQWVVIGLYVWSGLHKHSHDYYHYVHGFIARPLEPHLPASVFEAWNQAALVAPWFEFGAAVLLAFGPTRKLAVLLISGMHGYLLLCLGPLGSGWNSVIWPWNISMVLILWVLFFGQPVLPLRLLLGPRIRFAAIPAVLLAVFMPALRYADAWDNNLSFCLYSGKTKGLNFFIRESAVNKLPNEGRQHLSKTNQPGLRYMSADTWCMDELGVPINPQERIYKLIGKELCTRYFDGQDFCILIKRRPGYVEQGELLWCADM